MKQMSFAGAETALCEQDVPLLEKATEEPQPDQWTRRRKTWLCLAAIVGVIGLLHNGQSIYRHSRNALSQRNVESHFSRLYAEHFGTGSRQRHYSVSISPQSQPFAEPDIRAYAPTTPHWSTRSFLGLDGSSFSTSPRRTIPLFPRTSSLDAYPPDQRVRAADIVFAFATDVDRAKKMAPSWKHFLKHGSSCLIVLPPEEKDRHEEVAQMLAEQGLKRCKTVNIDLDTSIYGRYEHRMLYMPRALLAQDWQGEDGQKVDPRWYIVLDDDTHILDMSVLQRELSSRSHAEPNLLCGVSESIKQLRHVGRVCFGGAGIIISRALLHSMADILPECLEKFKGVRGGDGMLTECAALSQRLSVEQVMTEVPSLHRQSAFFFSREVLMFEILPTECDVQGDVSGILQSGLSFMTMHHYLTWFELFPFWHNEDRIQASLELWKAVELVGGDNL